MSGATPFASGVGSSSWADDDDVDIPVVKPQAQQEQEPIEEEPRHEDEASERRPERSEDERGSREDRGGYREDRGGYREDRGGYREDRGGYREDRGGYREDRRDREPRGYDRPKNPVPDQAPFKAYVGNLPFRMNENDLADFFGPRDIVDIRIPLNEIDRPKGFAYVEFSTRDALVAALELDGRDAGGRAIRVDVAIERERKPRQRDSFFERRSDFPDQRGPRGPREPREPAERHHLNLLPRSESTENKAATTKKSSIFGDAKPRDEAAYQERKERERKERERKAAEAKEAKAKAKQAREDRLAKRNEASETARNARPREDRDAPRGRPAPQAERSSTKRDAPRATSPRVAGKTKTATKVQNVFDLLNDDDEDSDSD